MPLQYQVNIFKELVERYPSWEDLQKYLESNEGGMFRIVDKNDNGLCLIRYEKGVTKMDLPHSKWFRSVVWNTKTNRPVSIAPSKVTTTELPFSTLKELSDENIVCQEFLEGFMINCFRAIDDETISITSRSKLDATGKFYSEKSFRELFMEAYMETYMETYETINFNEYITQEINYPDSLKKEIAVFYSFLVQHREHRIVKLNNKNRVYLVHKGIVYEDGSINIIDSPESVLGVSNIENISFEEKELKGSYAQVVSQTDGLSENLSDVQKWIKRELISRDWSFQGLVFKDNFGNRWRFRSEKYAAIKTLRGNSSNIIERFAQLYTQNLINKYLEYYTEDTMPITIYMLFMDTVVKILYDNYVDLHITKVKKAEMVDKMFLPHLYSIHGIYLSQLRPNNKKVTLDEIKLYLHKQPWQRIVFLIKKLVEKANAE
jgi:hypothetical protein